MTRNRWTLRILSLSLLASAMGSAVAFAQAPIILPLSHPALQQLKNNPQAWTQPAPSVPTLDSGRPMADYEQPVPGRDPQQSAADD